MNAVNLYIALQYKCAYINNIKKEIAFFACYHFSKILPLSDSSMRITKRKIVYIGPLSNGNK